MRPRCGKWQQHYYINRVCRRCGKRAADRPGPTCAPDYLNALADFMEFCQRRRLKFKSALVAAMKQYVEGKRR